MSTCTLSVIIPVCTLSIHVLYLCEELYVVPLCCWYGGLCLLQFVNASLQHSNGQVRDAALELTVQLYSQVKGNIHIHKVVTKVCTHVHAMYLCSCSYNPLYLLVMTVNTRAVVYLVAFLQ